MNWPAKYFFTMKTFDYNPYSDLQRILQDPKSLDELPELLNYINKHKRQVNTRIQQDIEKFHQNQPDLSSKHVVKLIESIEQTQRKSESIQSSIQSITGEIFKLDNLKKNLIVTMNVFKRLQILSYSIGELNQLLKTDYDYKDIYDHFSNTKQLLEFFKPYKSIDEINKLHLVMAKIETKLVDNIFIDFEQTFVHNMPRKDLRHGCLILELIDKKQKDKLLYWFYNLQLKEIKSIFNNFDEAGSLDNLNRRFIYFHNTLKKMKSGYNNIFPDDWDIIMELSKLFCEITKEDIIAKLDQRKISSETLLNCLNETLEFENSLNSQLKSNDFTRIILRVFEPYLSIWINEQDKLLNSKLVEFYSVSKIPQEFQSSNSYQDFTNVLKINSIPNISNSSTELFKTYNKLLIQGLRWSNGKIQIDLANLFNKYLAEYHNRILAPVINMEQPEPTESNQLEAIKYLTMVLNTGDYIINNLDDLYNKLNNVITPEYKGKFSFDNLKTMYLNLINRAIINLTDVIANDLKFSWRQFENNDWNSNESSDQVSNYSIDMKNCLVKNCRIILPLIIRDSYIRSFCNKIVELMIKDFANNLKKIKPLSILNIEQIITDTNDLKQLLLRLPLYSNPNYDEKSNEEEEGNQYYERFVNSQFQKLDTLLKLLLTPTLPIDNLIGNYFNLIHDKSLRNFKKFLSLKNLTVVEQRKYTDSFNSQLSLENKELIDESPVMALIQDDQSPTNSTSTNTPKLNTESGVVSPFPSIRSPADGNSPKLKINNLEKNLRELALNSENNINKFNENFKNFGKFFRKDNLHHE